MAALKGLFGDFAKSVIHPLSDQLKALATKPAPQPAPEPTPEPEPPAPGKDDLPPAVKAQLDRMNREVERLKKESADQSKAAKAAQEAAEKANRESALSTALAGFEFTNDDARRLVASQFMSQLNRAADGTLVVGDLPVVDAIKNALEGPLSFALKPKGTPGTGVGAPAAYGNKPLTLDDLDASADPARKAAAQARVVDLMQGRA
jgi:hypothetical protein